MKIEVWADVVCPWCYIGRRRLEKALAAVPEADAEVIHRAFELDPTPRAAKQGSVIDLLSKKYQMTPEQVEQMIARVDGLAAAEGIEMDQSHQWHGNTRSAHRLLKWAGETAGDDVAARLLERLMNTHFAQSDSVFAVDRLAAMAAEVGLDPAAAAAVVESGDYESSVAEDQELARAFGITGVPFFVFDRRLAVSGAQDTAVLEQAIREALASA